MEIKDLNVAEAKLDSVRGGLSVFAPRGGNVASNSSSNGGIFNLVGVAGHGFNNSGVTINNGVGQSNTTTQQAGVLQDHKWESHKSITDSQLSIGFPFFR